MGSWRCLDERWLKVGGYEGFFNSANRERGQRKAKIADRRARIEDPVSE